MTSDNHSQLPVPAFIERWEQILHNLKQLYLEAAKNKAGADFEQDICACVVSNDDYEVDDPVEIVRQLLPVADRSMSRDDIERISLAPLLVASVYCYRARQAVLKEAHELGWIYLVDAGYWCALARAKGTIGHAMRLVLDEARGKGMSVFANVGNKAQKEESDALISEAYRLVRDKKPKDGLWPTVGEAVLAIRVDVLAFARKRKIKKAAESNIDLRLRRALGKMPDAAKLFATKSAD
jgi:hypothetical protein